MTLDTRFKPLVDFWFVIISTSLPPSLPPSLTTSLPPLQTNDSSVVGVMKMENFVIVVCLGISLTNTSGRQLQKWMETHFHDNLTSVEVKGDGIGVAEFRGGVVSAILERSHDLIFSGQPVQLFPAFLIWIPFSELHVSAGGREEEGGREGEGGGGGGDGREGRKGERGRGEMEERMETQR